MAEIRFLRTRRLSDNCANQKSAKSPTTRIIVITVFNIKISLSCFSIISLCLFVVSDVFNRRFFALFPKHLFAYFFFGNFPLFPEKFFECDVGFLQFDKPLARSIFGAWGKFALQSAHTVEFASDKRKFSDCLVCGLFCFFRLCLVVGAVLVFEFSAFWLRFRFEGCRRALLPHARQFLSCFFGVYFAVPDFVLGNGLLQF